ncbi:ribosome assembly RNA-binding protein YhbY [Desulfuromonas sp. AOP6]|uniref:ribosome assembly RNA-binding protein YhbY n=1 Tax=Desulfuromonas sp. AOP6 TaxID=1566351 RepID=UPI0012872D11|nr:ribosome assembly RNA-binding protein YhbY [Desulfuromonas sp. AOP6]BCA79744.1 RNA-binding protein [Desulfuromonas sp. AOP6]
MESLKGKQVRYLRSLGHHLNPVVMVGRSEISDTLLTSIDQALNSHELIKIKIQEGCDLPRQEVADILANRCGAAVVQILGKTILLYRRSEDAKINLP